MREWKNVLRKSMESNRGAEDSPGGAKKDRHAHLHCSLLSMLEHRIGVSQRRHDKRVEECSLQVNREQQRCGRQPWRCKEGPMERHAHLCCSPSSMLECHSGVSQRRCEPKKVWKNVLRKSMESNGGAEGSPGGAEKDRHAHPS